MYSDEIMGFSISYPGDWETFQIDEVAVGELIDFDIGTAVRLLAVGLPLPDNNVSPNVNVAVEVLPVEVDSDQYASLTKQALVTVFPNYTFSEQVKASVGSRDSVLLTASFPHSDLIPGVDGYSWSISLLTTDGSAGWGVTCTMIGSETRRTQKSSKPATPS